MNDVMIDNQVDEKSALRAVQDLHSKEAEKYKQVLATIGDMAIKEWENPELIIKHNAQIRKLYLDLIEQR